MKERLRRIAMLLLIVVAAVGFAMMFFALGRVVAQRDTPSASSGFGVRAPSASPGERAYLDPSIGPFSIYAPTEAVADPARWTLRYWASFDPDARASWLSGYWTGLYAAKLVLNDKGSTWQSFVTFIDRSTALTSDDLERAIESYARRRDGRAYVMAPLVALGADTSRLHLGFTDGTE